MQKERAMTQSLFAKGRSSSRSRGFTLIEVMIVVAVLGLLAAIAYPSYTQYVLRANRSAAQQFMLQIASRQEQYRLDARTYASTVAALNLTQPAETASRFTFAIANTVAPPNAADYTITATAIGPQLRDKSNNKELRTFTLNNLGTKTYTDVDGTNTGWPER